MIYEYRSSAIASTVVSAGSQICMQVLPDAGTVAVL